MNQDEHFAIEWCAVPGGDVEVTRTWVTHPLHENGMQIQHVRRNLAPFKISRYPVSNALFAAFIEADDGYYERSWWDFSSRAMQARRPQAPPSATQSPSAPRTNISWFDAIAFCRWLSQRIGMTISLPDEFRWQHAALQAEALGLEGLGRVEEWCVYESPADMHLERVANRGGQHENNPILARRELPPDSINPSLGFRLLLVAEALEANAGHATSVDMDQIFTLMEGLVNPRHNLETRLKTLEALQDMHDPRAYEQLLEYLEKLLPLVQRGDLLTLRVAESLLNYHEAGMIAPWIRAIKTPDPALRAVAARGLSQYQEARALVQLLIAQRDEEEAVAAAALAGLQALGETIVPHLERCWQLTANAELRRVVVDGLERFGGVAAKPVLRKIVAEDTAPSVAAHAQRALNNLDTRD